MLKKLPACWFLIWMLASLGAFAQNANSCSGPLPTATGATVPNGQRSIYVYPPNHYQCYVCSSYTSVIQVQLARTDPQTNATTNWWEIIFNNFSTNNPGPFTPPGGLSWNTSTSSATDANRFLPNTCGSNTGPCGAVQICGTPNAPTRVFTTPRPGYRVWEDSVEIPFRSRGTAFGISQTVESGQTGVPIVGTIPRAYMRFRINNLITPPTFSPAQANGSAATPLTLNFTVGTGGGPGAWDANTQLVAQLLNLNGTIANANIGTLAAPTTTGCGQAQTLNATLPAGTADGRYLLRVIANNLRDTGFVSVDTLVVCQGVVPAAAGTITGSAAPCGSSTYSVPAINGATTYDWILPSGWTITAGAGTANITVNPGQPGDLFVRGVSGCGNGPLSPAFNAVPSGVPAAPSAAPTGPTSGCGSTAQYTIPQVSGATLYQWNLPPGWVITQGANTNTITATPGQPGNITVSAGNTCGQSAASPALAVSTGTPPATPVGPINGPARPCTTGTNTYSIAPVAGADSYNWTLPTGWTIVNGAGTNQITVNVTPNGGTISVRGVSAACGNGPALIVPGFQPSGTVGTPAAIAGPNPACEGPNVYRVSPRVSNATSYEWTVPQGWVISGSSNLDSVVVNVAQGSPGVLEVTALNGCGVSPATTLNIASVTPIAQNLQIGGATNIDRTGGQGTVTRTYTATISTLTTYFWTVTNGTILTGQGTPSIEVEWNAAPPTYPTSRITLYAVQNGCTTNVTSRTFNHNWGTTGLEDLLEPGTTLQLGPNPTTDGLLTLGVELQQQAQLAYRVLDVNGRLLNQAELGLNPGLNRNELRLGTTGPGLYLLELQVNNTRLTYRILQQSAR